MKRRALLSLFDKTGAVPFAQKLCALGFELISTGGTAKLLREAGIPVTEVSEITGFPECLDGRVKTLHPMIHAGILAMRSNPEHMKTLQELGVSTIDVVAINLYPFKQTIARPDVTRELAIENIDIGGPTMLRAAAKNWQDVAVIIDPADYDKVIEELQQGEVSRETKLRLSAKVFSETAAYDSLIAEFMAREAGEDPLRQKYTVTYEKAQSLRYGENPHQKAAFYTYPLPAPGTLAVAQQLHGKALSYNNLNDTTAAIEVLKEMGEDRPFAVAIKHANPCGVGTGKTILEAYQNAYLSDPVSIFGGIVSLNRPVDALTAAELAKTFLEVIIAPSFDPTALEILEKKQNIRLLALPGIAEKSAPTFEIKTVSGGALVQEKDGLLFNRDEMRCVTKRQPTEEELQQMEFAYRVVKHVKSNAIVLVKGNRTTGVGAGQTNRITALELAVKQAGAEAAGSVMGSDAFFPFSDCVELAKASGITAILQPGGSIRDEDSIRACDEAGIAMVFCGMRHFKH